MGIQNRFFLFFSLTEGTDVVVNSVADDVWGSEDELTGTLSEKVDSWDWIFFKLVQCICLWQIVEQIIYNGNNMKKLY